MRVKYVSGLVAWYNFGRMKLKVFIPHPRILYVFSLVSITNHTTTI